MKKMSRLGLLLAVSLACALAQAQQSSKPVRQLPPNQAAPRSDQPSAPARKPDASAGQSSSKEEPPDISPPQNDAKDHPESGAALQEAEDAAGLHEGDEIGGVQEFKVWNPHKAEKDVEVGDYYFKRKNYRAALSRYQEALYYKYDDAVATFRLAVCQEKLGDSDEARKAYAAYLKILPHGPFATEAQQALTRLNGPGTSNSTQASKPK